MKDTFSFLFSRALFRTCACAFAIIAMHSCALEDFNGTEPSAGNDPQARLRAKIVNTRVTADDDVLLIKMTSVPEDFKKSILQCGALSYSRVFPDVPGKEEKAARYGLDKWYRVEFPSDTDIDEAALKLASFADVERVQFNEKMYKASDCKTYPYEPIATKAAAAAAAFNDPALADQWNYINDGTLQAPVVRKGADINVADAWKLTSGNPSIIVAVVDEGVCYTHPDIAANMWTDANGNHGHNFYTDGPITWNNSGDSGHGTHVAGTIAAVNGNGIGVCGVAGGSGSGDGVKIMSCQIFDGSKGGSVEICAKAFRYAADNGACILQCSLGYDAGYIRTDEAYEKNYTIEFDALKYFMETSNCPAIDGGICIFAAGNQTTGMSAYPGAYHKFVSVTAIGPDNLPGGYTNYGPGCNIAAPGGDQYINLDITEKAGILSTLPPERGFGSGSGYGYMQGTSMACPHVSGVAALGLSYMLKLGRHCTNEEFVSMLLTSTSGLNQYLTGTKKTLLANAPGDINLSTYKDKMGTGTTDAWKMLMQVEGTPCIDIKVGELSRIDMTPYFGGEAASLTYTGVEISSNDLSTLGLSETPEIVKGRLNVTPTKTGCVKVTVKAIAGGNKPGGGWGIGGTEISKTISLIVRSETNANGGWL